MSLGADGGSPDIDPGRVVILPMFPLGSVLFPHVRLPLHVFEDRYRTMMKVLVSDPRATVASSGDGLTEFHFEKGKGPAFGVVLIERGSEVGGGDRRFRIGTVAEVLAAAQLPDGRWYLEAVGSQRLRVVEWVDEAPYPQALVELLSDRSGDGEPRHGEQLIERIDETIKTVRKTLALATEGGLPSAPATIEFDDDPMIRLWQACAVAPIGPLDDLSLLETATVGERVALLTRHLEDAQVLLWNRLTNG
jgi:uncharacterized protein